MALNSKPKKKTSIGNFLLYAIIFLLCIIIVSPFFFRNKEKIKLSFERGEVISFLFLTSNSLDLVNSATIISYNTTTNRQMIVSFMPETFMNFGSKYGHKTIAEIIKSKVGENELINSFEDLTNIDINYYCIIPSETIVKFIDLIGGVSINTNGIRDEVNGVRIPEGSVVLDGDKSKEYLTYIDKEKNPDYDQIGRIQNFIRSLFTFENFYNLIIPEKIIKELLFSKIKTNIKLSELIYIYQEITQRGIANNYDLTRGMENITVYCDKEYTTGYPFVLIPKNNGNWARLLIKESTESINNSIEEDVGGRPVIEVLNGTDVVGFATRTRSFLTPFGIDVKSVGNTEHFYEHTVILIANSEIKARKIADLIKCNRIIQGDISPERQLDAVLIIGKDFDGKIVK